MLGRPRDLPNHGVKFEMPSLRRERKLMYDAAVVVQASPSYSVSDLLGRVDEALADINAILRVGATVRLLPKVLQCPLQVHHVVRHFRLQVKQLFRIGSML